MRAFSITDSSLYPDIEDIVEDSPYIVGGFILTLHNSYAVIGAEDEDSEPGQISTGHVLSVDEIRDYSSAHTDHIVVKAAFPEGEYTAKIAPYAHNLEATLLHKGSDRDLYSRYKVILPKEREAVNKEFMQSVNREDLNIGAYSLFSFQLVSIYSEPALMPKVSGVYAGETPKNLLVNLSRHMLNSLEVEGSPPVETINVIEPSNKEKRGTLVVNTATRLLDLPDYIQRKIGVYQGGISRYIQTYQGKVTYFIYPTLETPVYSTDKTRDRLAIFMVPPGTAIDTMSTWKRKDNVIKVLASQINRDSQARDGRRSNRQYGYVHKDTTQAFLGTSVESKNGKVTSAGDGISKEVYLGLREDGLNVANEITPGTNQYSAAYSVLRNASKTIECNWMYSNTELLYPGMGVTIYTDVEGAIVEQEATLIHTHTVTAGTANGLMNDKFVNNTLLTCIAPII